MVCYRERFNWQFVFYYAIKNTDKLNSNRWKELVNILGCCFQFHLSPVGLRFHRIKTPTSNELTHLTHAIAYRVARHMERQGLLGRDTALIPQFPALFSKNRQISVEDYAPATETSVARLNAAIGEALSEINILPRLF